MALAVPSPLFFCQTKTLIKQKSIQMAAHAAERNAPTPCRPITASKYWLSLVLFLHSRLHAGPEWELPALLSPPSSFLIMPRHHSCSSLSVDAPDIPQNRRKRAPLPQLGNLQACLGPSTLLYVLNYHVSRRQSNIPLPEISSAMLPLPNRAVAQARSDHPHLSSSRIKRSLVRGDQNDSFPSGPPSTRHLRTKGHVRLRYISALRISDTSDSFHPNLEPPA